jgi:hypothetical protein
MRSYTNTLFMVRSYFQMMAEPVSTWVQEIFEFHDFKDSSIAWLTQIARKTTVPDRRGDGRRDYGAGPKRSRQTSGTSIPSTRACC